MLGDDRDRSLQSRGLGMHVQLAADPPRVPFRRAATFRTSERIYRRARDGTRRRGSRRRLLVRCVVVARDNTQRRDNNVELVAPIAMSVLGRATPF